MRRRVQLVLGFVACALAVSAAAKPAPPSILVGKAGPAYYKFAVPANWNGDLVVWNHGFSLAPVGPFSIDPAKPLEGLGPLAALQFGEGYAIAASSYRLTGWAVFRTDQDLREMVDKFEKRYGRPRQIVLFGASLGGIVTVSALEDGKLGNVVGALSVCGAVGGSRNWDAALDGRLVYDAVCAGVPGAQLPGDARGLPLDTTYTSHDMALAAHACTGILAPAAGRTAEQQARLDKILKVLGIPENFLLTDLGYALFGMGDLVFDKGKLHGHLGTGNENVDYGDVEINAMIERVEPKHGAEKRLDRNYTPTGDVGTAKIVSLHTDQDGLVFVENEGEYASKVAPERFSLGIVREEIPSHCNFNTAELVAGWESLRGWLAGAPQPTATVLQGTCLALTQAPYSLPGPCRIDPTAKVGTLDDRIRPR